MMNLEKGVVLVAYGGSDRVNEASVLAWSIRRSSLEIPIALVTDLETEIDENPELFSAVIRSDFCEHGSVPFKLFLYELSPFEETIFLDTDCLVFGQIELLFEKFGHVSFSPFCHITERPSRSHFGRPDLVADLLKRESYHYHGGYFYYFKKNEKAKRVFESARDALDFAPSFEFKKSSFSSKYSEEPLFAMAIDTLGTDVVMSDPSLCLDYGYMGYVGGNLVSLDLHQNRCRASLLGQEVNVLILHFGEHSNRRAYQSLKCCILRNLRAGTVDGLRLSDHLLGYLNSIRGRLLRSQLRRRKRRDFSVSG